MNTTARPKIVVLCGSTRFKREFELATLQESLKDHIVLSVCCFTHADNINITRQQKIQFNILHYYKIDLADEVLVIDVGGYIGQSTQEEIDHARAHRKPIRFWSQEYTA